MRAGRAAMAALWWSGARSSGLPLATGERLMLEMLMPALCYGSEVTQLTQYQVAAIESLQASAGGQLLGLPRVRTTHAMVRGELGWVRMAARRDVAQLRFLQRLHTMPTTLLTRIVYDQRRATFDKQAKERERERAAEEKKSRRPQYGFCTAVQETLDRYGLQLPSTISASRGSSNGAPAAAGAASSSEQRARRLAARDKTRQDKTRGSLT